MAKTKAATAKKTTLKKVAPKKTTAKKAVKKVAAKKTVAKKAPQKIANNKSKIAPYKSKKNEKYMSAAMKRHFCSSVVVMERTFIRRNAKNI
jgi:DnaK suppressor protein